MGFYVENFDYLMFDDVKFSMPTIAAENITLDHNRINLNEGKQILLHATVLPDNAADKSIIWTSSDPNIATVDESGFVSALRLGQADITAALAENPNITAVCRVTVSDTIHFTDFEPSDAGTGANGWGVDAYHSIETDANNNHWYKLINGANSKSSVDFTDYILEFKLRTPVTISNGAFFMIYERDNGSGTGRIGYFVNDSGAPRWDIMDNSWTVVKSNPDVTALQPDTEYNIKIVAVGPDISVYINDSIVVQGSNPEYNPSGKVGFYVENFDNLMFDNIRFSMPRKQVESLTLSDHALTVEAGDIFKLGVSVNPSDATNRRVIWSSSDSSKAIVDKEGNVTALAPGNAVISAASGENETIKDSCNVHIDALNYVAMPIDSMLQQEKNWTPYNMFKVENNSYVISSAGAISGSEGAVGYTAAKFSNEVFKFKAKMDFGNGENPWYGFSMRNDQAGKVIWSGINGYLIVVKKEQIELQRWNPGTTMLKIIPNNNQIIKDGQEHLIEIGVIKKGQDNKIYFKVDEAIVFNYLDKGVVNPVPDSGYFGFLNFNNGDKTMRISSLEPITVELDPERDNPSPSPELGAPVNLAATATSGSGISLSWEPADESGEIAGYRVYRDGTLAGETTTTGFIDTNVWAGSAYTYTVRAFDASGNESPDSTPVTVKFEAGPSLPPSSSSSSQDSPPATDVSVKENGEVIITVPAKLNVSSGNAVAEISMQLLNQAFKKAAEGKDGKKTISIELKETKKAKGYSLKVPTEILISDKYDKDIRIESPLGTVIISNNIFNGMIGSDAESIDLLIRIADTSKIAGKLKEKIAGKPAVEISTVIGGKKAVWDNPKAPVTILVPYEPNAEELKAPEYIVVWCIDASGQTVPVPSGMYNTLSGQVEFKTTHLSKYAVAYDHITFTDTQNVSWAEKAIEVLASKGIILGTPNTAYKPDTKLTRAEFLVYLIRSLELNAEIANNFSDINPDKEYYDEIGIAKQLGITTGTGGNKFSPDLPVSRQDMMVLTEKAMRIAGKIETTGSKSDLKGFKDLDKVSDYAVKSIAALVKDKMILGTDGKINPLENVTKAQAAVVIYRIYNK